jgi:hypothetical protein
MQAWGHMADEAGPHEADVHRHLAAEVRPEDVDPAWEPHVDDAHHVAEVARDDDHHVAEVARDEPHVAEVGLVDIPDERAVGLHHHVHRHAETDYRDVEERLEDWLLAHCVSLQQDRGGANGESGHR